MLTKVLWGFTLKCSIKHVQFQQGMRISEMENTSAKHKLWTWRTQKLKWKIYLRGSPADQTEGRIDELKDKSLEIIQSEDKRRKKMNKTKRIYSILSRRPISRQTEKKTQSVFKEIMAKTSCGIKWTLNPRSERIQKRNPKKFTPRHIIIKLSKVKNKTF